MARSLVVSKFVAVTLILTILSLWVFIIFIYIYIEYAKGVKIRCECHLWKTIRNTWHQKIMRLWKFEIQLFMYTVRHSNFPILFKNDKKLLNHNQIDKSRQYFEVIFDFKSEFNFVCIWFRSCVCMCVCMLLHSA